MQQERIKSALSCKDVKSIPKVIEAGKIITKNKKKVQVMHNGVLVYKDSYHKFITQIISGSRGHHEPQEEKVFYEILKQVPKGAVMIELGSFWAYYSMWFNKEIPHAKNFMIEPNKEKLAIGKKHFSLNNMKGSFTRAAIGKENKNILFELDDGTHTRVKQVNIKGFMKEKKLKAATIVHSDIQGAEYDMLLGAPIQKIEFFVISTHSEFLHQRIIKLLQKKGHTIIAEHTPAESFSGDGLIASSRKKHASVNITKRKSFESIIKKIIAKTYIIFFKYGKR